MALLKNFTVPLFVCINSNVHVKTLKNVSQRCLRIIWLVLQVSCDKFNLSVVVVRKGSLYTANGVKNS